MGTVEKIQASDEVIQLHHSESIRENMTTMSHLPFPYSTPLPTSSSHPQFSTSSPATSPNISVSGSNMSPICSEEAPSVSPPLPPRLHASLPDSAPGSRLSSSLSDAPAGPPPHPSPQFPGLDPSNLAALSAGYPRLGGGMMGLGAAMPTLPYSSSDQNPYSSISMENFYSPLANPYQSIKEGSAPDMPSWPSGAGAGLAASAGYYPYDTSSLAAYGYGGAYGLAGTRKNVTRESTATLKAWLNEHKKNPYPTKGEKIMLAIITKMTLTQVSTWFANARRRLKKENKMTWEPKNKLDDEDVDVSDDDDKDRDDDKNDETDPRHSHLSHMGLHDSKNDSSTSAGIPIPPSKPKIWSLADTAVCKTPPPSGGGAQSHLPPSSHHQQQAAHYQQPPPHSQSYLSSGLGGTNTSLAAASWGPNFSQFVDPAMMRLRHGNMLGMGVHGFATRFATVLQPL